MDLKELRGSIEAAEESLRAQGGSWKDLYIYQFATLLEAAQAHYQTLVDLEGE